MTSSGVAKVTSVNLHTILLPQQLGVDQAGGERGVERKVDPLVAQLVERSVREHIGSIRGGKIPARKALRAVADGLVAELSADQFLALWDTYASYPDTPAVRLLLNALTDAAEQPRGDTPGAPSLNRPKQQPPAAAPSVPPSLPKPPQQQQRQAEKQQQAPRQRRSRGGQQQQQEAGEQQEAEPLPLQPSKRQRATDQRPRSSGGRASGGAAKQRSERVQRDRAPRDQC